MTENRFGAVYACAAGSEVAPSSRRILTERDFLRLEALLYSDRTLTLPVRRVLEEVLADANVVPDAKVDADIVTIGSMVHYKLGNLSAECRQIVLPGAYLHRGAYITLDTALGVSLIGRRAPCRFEFRGGATMACHLLELKFQPEHAVRNYG